jgi:hypothetical protein
MITKDSIRALEEHLGSMKPVIKSSLSDKLTRFTQVDKYLEKTGDYSSETLRGEIAAAAGQKKIRNIEIPICHIQRETAQAYLTGTFLSGFPIFAATSSRKNELAASQLTALVGRDQNRLGWLPELVRIFDDVLRYNVCGAAITWENIKASTAQTVLRSDSANTGGIKSIVYSGNRIKRIDPYNLFYDNSVEASKVHVDGDYVGWVEAKTYIGVKSLYMQMNSIYTIKANIRRIISKDADRESRGLSLFQKPVISKPSLSNSDGTDFSNFWGSNTSISMPASKYGAYEVVHIYQRIIPREFKLAVPQDGEPQVFYLIYVNGLLAYAEPIKAGHEYLPVVLGQLYPGSQEKKSFVEYITDCQDLATSFMTGTLNAMRRAVEDRALYDPTRVRKADVDSNSPVSKIPVTSNLYSNTLESAYRPIPFTDTVSGNFQSMMNGAIALAEKTTGINPSAQGNFTPGNKTMQEFNSIMNNSQARLQLGALNLEGLFFNPVKEILKLNYLVYAKPESVDHPIDKNVSVDIDPVLLRETAPDFKMADGLMPSTKQANTQILTQAFTVMQNNPQLSLEYDVGGILVSVLHQQGATNLSEFKRSPEQQQQYLAQMQQMNTATTPQPQQPAGTKP